MKFALEVEGALNTIPRPDFRQLMVEALLTLALMVEYNVVQTFGGTIYVEEIVRTANKLFLEDQLAVKGDSILCCASSEEIAALPGDRPLSCGGNDGVCRNFYDSAPSGTFGTMTYLVRACCITLDAVPKEGDIDCQLS
jgi:phosphorylase kinase alpha/beta subunit